MRFDVKITAARIINMVSNGTATIAGCIQNIIEARRRKAEQEREFYRKLKAYCHANNLSPVSADDWKTYN
jgi:hypothetical protein